ncbi:MAG TPA: ChaB family protein [Candidatus Babeliales bacterium]|nr:ChaB family protein [Candidatus Babeliales bacterium]
MPYKNNNDLPAGVRNHLPDHAQSIYRKAFNNAIDEYGDDDARAARVAWGAVKKEYAKKGTQWVAKKQSSSKTKPVKAKKKIAKPKKKTVKKTTKKRTTRK